MQWSCLEVSNCKPLNVALDALTETFNRTFFHSSLLPSQVCLDILGHCALCNGARKDFKLDGQIVLKGVECFGKGNLLTRNTRWDTNFNELQVLMVIYETGLTLNSHRLARNGSNLNGVILPSAILPFHRLASANRGP